MSLAYQVLVGLGLGVFVGLFIGSMAAPLGLVASVYIRLLQMSILPYAVVSVVGGLGAMVPSEAGRLARCVGRILIVLWLTILAAAALAPLAFPAWPSSSFFSPTMVEDQQKIDLIGLYVPENPIAALADNIVPASILFSLFFGAALMMTTDKQHVLAPLEVISAALTKIVMSVMRFMPIGVFAIAASTAGTLSIEECEQLEVYIAINVVLCTVLALLVLPYMVSQWSGVSFRSLMREAREALVLAFATCNVFVTLPLLIEKVKSLAVTDSNESGITDFSEASATAELILPIAFNLPMAGELLALYFVPFAAWASGFPISYTHFPAMLLSGFISSFGDLNATIPFLLNLMHVPTDTYQLFVMTAPISAHFLALLSAMYLLSLAVLSVYALNGRLKWSWSAALRSAAVAIVSVGVSLAAVLATFTFVFPGHYTKREVLTQRGLLWGNGDIEILKSTAEVLPVSQAGNRLKELKKRGFLRVACYSENSVPMVFRNSNNELVGFDVELVHLLAKDIGVRLELYRIERKDLWSEIASGRCDLAIPGVPVAPDKAAEAMLSAPYVNGTLAFFVKDYRRDVFASWESIRAAGPIKVGIGPTPYYQTEVLKRAPDVQIIQLKSFEDVFKSENSSLDASLTAAETGSAWSVLYPEYCVAVPRPDPVKVPVSFALRPGDTELRDFLTLWVDLKQKNGDMTTAFDYWFLGKSEQAKQKRWSIIKDVLHWVK